MYWERFLKWLWVLAEACPLGESFTSQICKLFAWHFGEEVNCCFPESMVKTIAAKQAKKRKKDLETSLSWLEKRVSDFTWPADYLKMIPVSFRGDTCSSVVWMQQAGSGSRVMQVSRIRVFTSAVLFLFNELFHCGLCR